MFDYVIPSQFGTIGGSDDRPAIQASIDSGSPVFLPWRIGGYKISSRLSLPTGAAVKFSDKPTQLNLTNSGEWLFEITGSDVTIDGLTSDAGAVPVVGGVLFRTDLASLERVTLKNFTTYGVSTLLQDMPSSSNRMVLLKLSDLTSYGTRGSGVKLTRSFAYQYAERVNILYNGVPNPTQSGWFQVGLEGGFFNKCDVTSGTVNGTNGGNHGFEFESCKAIWMSSSMSDMVGGGGLYIKNSEYIYVDRFISSMVGTHGISLVNSHKVTLSSCNVGGRSGMPYAPAMPGIYASNCADLIIDDGCRVYGSTGTPVQLISCPRGKNNAYIS